jgi:hypothetical protein
MDEQNLSISAEELGFKLNYGLLAERIHATSGGAELHIFAAAHSHDQSVSKRFQRLSYQPHIKTIRHIQRLGGREYLDCNIDNLFAFWAGSLTAKTACEVLLLASGDYGLSGELATAIRQQHSRTVSIMTLSLPGSTAFDLDARTNPDIAANLEIGLDLLKPNGYSKRQLPAGYAGYNGRFSFNSLTDPLF